MKKRNFEVYGITDTGAVKTVNEDGLFYKAADLGNYYSGIFAIADGVGGLERGEVASSVAISNMNKWWEHEFKNNVINPDYLICSLITSFKNANRELLDYSFANDIRTATTLSTLFINNDDAVIVHIGDSRIYKYSKKICTHNLEQVTIDHSTVINKKINGRTVTKSVLTECLGNKKEINYYTSIIKLTKDDIFIVCSDGIYKTLEKRLLQKLIEAHKNNMKDLCNTLIETAKQKGETDNISVIAVRLSD